MIDIYELLYSHHPLSCNFLRQDLGRQQVLSESVEVLDDGFTHKRSIRALVGGALSENLDQLRQQIGHDLVQMSAVFFFLVLIDFDKLVEN